MRTRSVYATVIFAAGIVLCALLLGGWSLGQIYGIGGWRDEVYTLVGADAARQAMDDFQQGYRRLYVFGGGSARSRFTGSNNGPFEIWIPSYRPSLGRAHRYSTEQFIEFYNAKMRYMCSHPEKFEKVGKDWSSKQKRSTNELTR